MYDIKPLENEWKQYKKNKRKPYIYTGILVALVSTGSVYFYNFENFSLPSFPSSVDFETLKRANTIESSILINDAISDIQTRQKESIEEIKSDVKIYIENPKKVSIPTLPVVNEIPVLDVEPKRKVIRKKPKAIIKTRPKKIKPRKKTHLNIIESSSVSAYRDVEKRFYASHDTDDSLFLAKSYFRKGNYKKSEYWALQTNKVNANIEESWLIFAKSKLKLGRKNEAIRILSSYIKQSNSSLARNMLYKLKKN